MNRGAVQLVHVLPFAKLLLGSTGALLLAERRYRRAGVLAAVRKPVKATVRWITNARP
jgi:hypothetical protein